MVSRLVAQLLKFDEVSQIVVTLNIPERFDFEPNSRVFVVNNSLPQGFAQNHNQAFWLCSKTFFCPINPDVEMRENPFPTLLAAMEDLSIGLVAPKVNSPDGHHEDSWRRFPTLRLLLSKVFGQGDGRYCIPGDGQPFAPEWVAGMFMLFRRDVFARLGGFDEAFFLYYEDVDICVRLWKCGYRLLACPECEVIHDARRDSHRKLSHLRWHLSSMLRYFAKHWGRLPRCSDSLP